MATVISGTTGVTFPDGSNEISHSAPQVTVYTSGSGTYTPPANAQYLHIKMVGGGGGGAGGGLYASNGYSGPGGGAGGYIEAIINSPLSSYSYAIGAGGTAGSAGSGGYAGGSGGSGVIMITAYF